jgi:hypothetical protein
MTALPLKQTLPQKGYPILSATGKNVCRLYFLCFKPCIFNRGSIAPTAVKIGSVCLCDLNF